METIESLRDSDKEVAIDIVLRRLIDKKYLKQSEVARAINMPQSTFHDWTYGRIPRDLKTVRKLADYFDVSFEYMVFGTEDDQDVLKKKVQRLEMENAMMKLESSNQLSLLETKEQALERIEEMKKQFVEKFGEAI